MNVVFHQAALGDFALIVPLLRGLAAENKTAVVAPWSHGRLAATLAPEVATWDIEMFEFTRLWAPSGPTNVSPAVSDLLGDATRVVSFVAGPKSEWAENVRRLAPDAGLAFVASRPTTRWKNHISEWHAVQLHEQGVDVDTRAVQPEAPDRTFTQPGVQTADRDWLIHPGSGGPAKCWDPTNFFELREALEERSVTSQFLVGDAEVERGLADRLIEHVGESAVTHCRDTDMLLHTLRGAAGYLGHDTGPTHVAALLGLRTVALFGPTDPRVWSPVGPDVTAVTPDEPEPMTWLSVERVLQAMA